MSKEGHVGRLPSGSAMKSACQCRRRGFDPDQEDPTCMQTASPTEQLSRVPRLLQAHADAAGPSLQSIAPQQRSPQ